MIPNGRQLLGDSLSLCSLSHNVNYQYWSVANLPCARTLDENSNLILSFGLELRRPRPVPRETKSLTDSCHRLEYAARLVSGRQRLPVATAYAGRGPCIRTPYLPLQQRDCVGLCPGFLPGQPKVSTPRPSGSYLVLLCIDTTTHHPQQETVRLCGVS